MINCLYLPPSIMLIGWTIVKTQKLFLNVLAIVFCTCSCSSGCFCLPSFSSAFVGRMLQKKVFCSAHFPCKSDSLQSRRVSSIFRLFSSPKHASVAYLKRKKIQKRKANQNLNKFFHTCLMRVQNRFQSLTLESQFNFDPIKFAFVRKHIHSKLFPSLDNTLHA